jgi:hypothetical protein
VGVLAREVEALRETLRSWADMARWAWARRPSPPRTAALVFAAGAALAGALAVVAQVRLPSRLPSAGDWAALRALIERDARPGDALALSPPWAERAREVLPLPVPVLAHRRYAGEDLVGVRRLWLVSLPRAPAFTWDPELDVLQRAARSDPPLRLGALEVARYEISFPVLPLAFLPDRLAQAAVSHGEVACAGDGAGAFRCADEAVGVRREVREVGGAARPCLVASAGRGLPLALTFPAVRVGRVVRGHLGALGGASLPAPVRVAVRVEAEEAGAAEISGPGFVPFEVDTSRFAGAAHPLSIVLTTPGDAELCLDAVTLP